MNLIKTNWKPIVWGFFVVLFGVSLWPYFVKAVTDGQDFKVYWNAARSMWSGQPLYSLVRDQPNVFKYPPWSIVFVLPLAPLPWIWASAIWASASLFCLVGIAREVMHFRSHVRVSGLAMMATLALFLPVVMNHSTDGQVVILMLYLGLLGLKWIQAPHRHFRGWFSMALGLSIKVTTLVPAIQFAWTEVFAGTRSRYLNLRRIGQVVLATGLVFLIMSLPALFVHGGMIAMLKSWGECARSWGGWEEFSLGFYNSGLPAFVARLALAAGWVASPAKAAQLLEPLGWVFLLASVLATPWIKGDPVTRFYCFLALSPCVQPLGWRTSFILALPLVGLGVAKVAKCTRVWPRLLVLAAILLVTMPLAKLPQPWGAGMGWVSHRAIGVLMLIFNMRYIRH